MIVNPDAEQLAEHKEAGRRIVEAEKKLLEQSGIRAEHPRCFFAGGPLLRGRHSRQEEQSRGEKEAHCEERQKVALGGPA